MKRLDGKIAIVTGAARGLGAAHATRLVADGAMVLLTDLNVEQGEGVAASLGSSARFMRHDVREEADWLAVVDAAEELFGTPNVLVNNAGIGPVGGPMEQLSAEDYRRCMDVNQLGVFLGIKSVIPAMTRVGGGSIINISSAGGIVGLRYCMDYVASKFAVRGMTKAAALELADRNIRVNSIHPGVIRTDMMSEQKAQSYLSAIPLNRFGEPADIAATIAFLASDDAAYITGAEFVIDGGMLAQ